MSEQQGDATNVWNGPQVAAPGPVPPREPAHDQTSASERAFAEGWPAQPGWVPEGGVGTAWGQAPQQFEQYEPQQYAPQPGQTWVPQQAPYPAGGYPPAGGNPYPGPDAPLPGSKSATTVVVSVLAALLLVVAAVAGVIFFKRGSSDSPTVAAPTAAPGGVSANTGVTGGRTEAGGSTSGGSTSGSSTTGGSGTKGSTSTTAPMTSATSIDLTTVHVPAYAASPDANDVAHTLDAYFTGINSADYSTAYDQLSSSMQAKNPYGQFADDTAGTIDSDVTVTGVTVNGDGSAKATVTFTSTQPGDKGVVRGQTCTNWSISYSLQLGGGAGGWLINGTPSAQHSGC